MQINSLRIAALGVLLAAAPLPAAFAHDLWLVPTRDGTELNAVLNFGDPGKRDMPVLQRLYEVNLVSASGTVPLRDAGKFTESKVFGFPVLISPTFPKPTDDTIMTARYDNGFWVKTPNGMRNVTQRLVPGAKDTFWVGKFSKTLFGPGAYKILAGHEIELIPLEDPFLLPPGQKLHVRLILRGKPVTDAEVRTETGLTLVADKDVPQYPTGPDGVAAVPLPLHGPWVIAVEYKTKGEFPATAATDQFNVTLAFTLK